MYMIRIPNIITPDGLIRREDAYDGRWQAEEERGW
jgi:hypothetical protein